MIHMELTQAKKDFRTSRWLLSAVTVASIFAQAPIANAESSTDGAPLATEVQQDAAAQGRAYLTVEDLKTLLGVNSRDPSAVESRANTEARFGSYDFSVSLSNLEKKALVEKIRKLESERHELSQKVTQEVAAQKAEMRKERQKLQTSRLKSGSNNDAALARSLFESILTESNLEARLDQELEAFDNQHLVSIDFESADTLRVVQSISIGENLVWDMNHNAQRVAKK